MRPEIPLVIIAACLGLALIWLAVFLALRTRQRRAKGHVLVRRGECFHVPLVAAFSGWKRMPWLSWSHSNIGPRLVLHPDYVECKVVWRRRMPYSRIEQVDYRRTIGTENIVLNFTDSLSSFSGNTANRAVARAAIRHFQDRGCPISARALSLMAEDGA